ncbi:MAG TPA: SPOR domain-containing protein [Steroidobacteraceae bacterium]|nr:SPOR domain-containing protein [Steroidobacteraceae bacterium]
MKERLTGAIILVALIVLLVPELLTGPIRAKSAPSVSATSASQPAGRTSPAEPPLRSYTLTLGAARPVSPEPAAQTGEGSADSAPSGSSSALPSAPGSALPQGAAPADAHPPAAGASVAQQSAGPGSGSLQVAESPAHSALREARSSASSGGWVVQLGSFASRQNAARLARSLSGRGFRMSVSPARAGIRVLWRVRAGPAHDRAGAQRLAARLEALGHRGELLPVR